MEEETEEAMLDTHFRALLSRHEGYLRNFACNSDLLIIDKWLEIFYEAPACEKLARNGLMLLLQGHLSEFGYLKDPFTDMRNLEMNLNSVLDNYHGIAESMAQCGAKESPSDMSVPAEPHTENSSSPQAVSEPSSELGSSDQDPSSAVTVIRNVSHCPDSPGCHQQPPETVMQKVQSFERIAQRTEIEAALSSTKSSEQLQNFRKILAKRTTSVHLPSLTRKKETRKASGTNEFASLGDLKHRFEELARRLGIESSQDGSEAEERAPATSAKAQCDVLRATPSLGEHIRSVAQGNNERLPGDGTTERLPGGAELERSVMSHPSLGEKIRVMSKCPGPPTCLKCTTATRTKGDQNQMPKSLIGKHVRFLDQQSCEHRFKDATTGCTPRGCEPMENPSAGSALADRRDIRSSRIGQPRSKDAATEWTPRSKDAKTEWTPRSVDAITEWTPRDGIGIDMMDDQKTSARSARHKKRRCKDATTEWTPKDGEKTGRSSLDEQICSRCRMEPLFKDATTEWTPRDGNPTEKSSCKPSQHDPKQNRRKDHKEPRSQCATMGHSPRGCEPIAKPSARPSKDDRNEIRSPRYEEPRSKDATTERTPRDGIGLMEIRSKRHEEPRFRDATTEWTPRDGHHEPTTTKSNKNPMKPSLDDIVRILTKFPDKARSEVATTVNLSPKQIQEEPRPAIGTPAGQAQDETAVPSLDDKVRELKKRNEELRRQCLVYYHEDGRLRKNPADVSQFKRLSKGFEIGVFRGMQRLRRWNGAPHSLKFFLTVFKSCGVHVGHSRLRSLDRRLEQMATRWLDEQLRIRRERVWSLYRQSVEAKAEPVLTPRVAKELDQLIESRKEIILEEMAHTAKLKELWVAHCLGKIRDQQLEQVLQKLDEKYLKLVKGLNKLARRQDKLSKHSATLGRSLINLI